MFHNYVKQHAIYRRSMIQLFLTMCIIWLAVPLLFHVLKVNARSAIDGLALGLNIDPVIHTANWITVGQLFLRNYGLAWLYVILAIIPIPFYWLFTLVNALTVGIVLAGSHPLSVLLLGILPHGVFEILAQLITLSIAGIITAYSEKSVAQLWHPEHLAPYMPVKQLLLDMVTLVSILYLIAAMIEAFVTPTIVTHFYPL